MLEFTEVFTKGYDVDNEDIGTIMKCKNINFGHVNWTLFAGVFSDNIMCMVHIIDNIIDINVYGDNNIFAYTFFVKIIRFSKYPYVIHYMLNNGHVNNKSFEIYHSFSNDFNLHLRSCNFCDCCPHKQFDKLTNYLTRVSLGKFTGYYNIEKYYDMMYTMLLIMKAQHKLPTTVIKHLIIPFIYQ